MKTTTQLALTFVVLSLLGSRASAAISSTDDIFTRITTGRIVTDGGQSGSAAAVDYDGDGWPDIYVGNGGGGSDAVNFLYRNNGNGTFARTNVAGVATDPGKTVSAAWGDYDNDGFPDLVVAHWPNQNNFQYRNNGNGQFSKDFWQLRQISNWDGVGNGTLTAHFEPGDATNVETLRIDGPRALFKNCTMSRRNSS